MTNLIFTSKQLLFSLILILLISGCATTKPEIQQALPQDAEQESQEALPQDTEQESQQALPSDTVTELQTKIDELTTDSLPPGMVVWIDTPEYRFEGASGFANLVDNTPMISNGAFRIGSVTKMFTAAVVMQLAEDGVLTLDDPLALWLPDVADQLPHGDQITIHQLLSHTSGLFNIVEHESYYTDLFTEMIVDEAAGIVTLDCVERDPHDTLARYVYGKEAQFEPGTQWRYSNTNYALLGMIIEAATEKPLAEAYQTHIYEPLDMTSTFLDCYEESKIDVVHGYTGFGDAMADLTNLHESIGWSAGGLVSTPSDLTKFARGLFDGLLFDEPESLSIMTTPAPNSAHGLGLMYQGGYMGHAGFIAGYRSLLSYDANLDAIVVILYNHDGADPEQALADVMIPVLSVLQTAE